MNKNLMIPSIFGISILVIGLFFVPVDVEGLTVVIVRLDKSEYGVGDQPFVTVQDSAGNLDSNEIDSVNVDVRALVAKGYAGTLIDTVEIQETGPNTGIFSGSLPAISLDDMKNNASGLTNTLIEVTSSTGGTSAALIAPPEPEPTPEPTPQTSSESQYDYGSSGCPQISNWELEDYDLQQYDYYDRLECSYFDHDSNLSPRSSLTSHIVTSQDAAKGVDTCSGNWIKNYYQGELYSSTHQLNVYYQYDDDDNYDQIISAAKSLLQQLESKNAAVKCNSAPAPTPTPAPPTTPEYTPPTTPEYTPPTTPKYIPPPTQNKNVQEEISMPNPGEIKQIPISGEIQNAQRGMPVEIKITKPDGTIESIGTLAKSSGDFFTQFNINDKSIPGIYKIDVSYNGQIINSYSVSVLVTKLPDKTPQEIEYDSWIKQGSTDLKNGNFDEAIENFDLAYKQNPNDQNLINLKADALKKKGMALVEDGKFDLGVVFLGESDYLKPDAFVKASQNNAYNRWSDEIRTETVVFDPKINDHYDLLGTIPTPPLPITGKVSIGGEQNLVINRLGQGVISDVSPGTPLRVGDIILVDKSENGAPVTLDWGYATTTIEPGSIFLIGQPEDLKSFAQNNPDSHYVELVNGQLRVYDDLTKKIKFDENYSFLVKAAKNPIMIGGTDVTINHDETTGISSIQIDDGWVEIFDVTTNELKKFGVGTKLVTNNDGYFLVESAAAELICDFAFIEKDGQCVPDPSHNAIKDGGCLIATATYGSELAPQVQQLRELRDNTLLQTESGTTFMNTFNEFYYSFSPTIADLERENPVFREAVKIAITPMISTLSLMEYADSENSVITIGVSLIILNGLMYFGIPAAVIVGVRKL
jgi:tetratricopeptide (TPR) repeat protein